jgi:cell cycle sensor histidine kinase DivJ
VAALSHFIDQILPDDLCADAHDHARHHAFLTRALSLPVMGALTAPLLVSLQGALPLWQSMALVAGLIPILSILLMQRAQIFVAQIMLVGAWAALAASLSIGLGFSLAVFACLAAAFCEAHLQERGRINTGILLGVLTLALVVGAPRLAPSVADLVLSFCAALYVVNLVMQMRQEAERQQESFKSARHHHDALEQVLGDLRLHFNRAGAVSLVDPAVREKMPLTRRDLSGRGFFERVMLADRPALIKALGDAVQSGKVKTLRVHFHLRDEESPRARFVTPIYVPVDIRLQALASDEILALVRMIEPVAARLSEDQAWKEQLIANVSHELRAPLNAIIGFSDLLAAGPAAQDEAQRRDYAQIIQTSGQHLLDLVNALLDMSKMQSGAFPVMPDSFAFATLVDECCDMLKLKADEGGLSLRRQVQRDAGEMVADRRACKQILINLLSNAIKFTPQGGTVTVHAQQSGQDVLLAVRDTGVGIAPEDLPRLGDPFFQAQSDEPRALEGSGLGLSLVKGLVGLHGGAIAIESAPGQGTCVTIRLPMDCRPFAAGHAKPAIIHSAPRVAAGPLPDMMMVKKIA